MASRYEPVERMVLAVAGIAGLVGLVGLVGGLSANGGLSADGLADCALVVLGGIAVVLLVELRRKLRLDHEAMRFELGESVREATAAMQLVKLTDTTASLPAMGDWAMKASALLALVHLVRRDRPTLVVELGSGSSTVMLGHAVASYGGRVVSLDHEAEFAERTRAQLAEHDLLATCRVIDAPLVDHTIAGRTFRWYDLSSLDELDGIALLVVDGPPGSTGQRARYPALPLLADRMQAGAYIVLDDVDRPDEQDVLRRWEAEHGLEPIGLTAPRIAIRRFPGGH